MIEKEELKTELKVEDKGDKVSREAYEKALTEKRNVMEALAKKDLEIKEMNEKLLRDKDDVKGLYELKSKELEEALKLNATLKVDIENKVQKEVIGKKHGALRTELAKLGADSKAIEGLLQISKIEGLKYDTDHDVVLGSEDEAKRLKEIIPAAFLKVQAKVDHSAGGDFKVLNIEDYKNISKPEDMKAAQRDLFAAHGITLKK